MLKALVVIALLSVAMPTSTAYPMTANLGSSYAVIFNGYSVCTDQLFRDLVSKYQYPMESHKVTTDDGYILQLFRVQAKGSGISAGKEPVLVQHGLLDSADNFVVNGESNSIVFLLASHGFDVWVSNSRGNKYSRAHKTKNPSSKEFWDYSFHEMGKFDIPANINFILGKTAKSKLTYIGHSQGTTQMFAALGSETSDFINKRVKKFIALAPVVFPSGLSDPVLARISTDTTLVRAINFLGINEALSGVCTMTFTKWLQDKFCLIASSFCSIMLQMSDENPWYNNKAITSTLSAHYPSGTSIKSLLHFRQQIINQDSIKPRFTLYDYGEVENIKIYGKSTPTEYDLNRIQIPVRLFVGKQDKIATFKDSMVLSSILTKLKKDVKVYPIDNCGHGTFVWANDFMRIFNNILSELK